MNRVSNDEEYLGVDAEISPEIIDLMGLQQDTIVSQRVVRSAGHRIKLVDVKYSIENGAIIKQIQPGRSKTESCKVVKLEGDDMILHCNFLYYLLKC
jgi:hypothetical protein